MLAACPNLVNLVSTLRRDAFTADEFFTFGGDESIWEKTYAVENIVHRRRLMKLHSELTRHEVHAETPQRGLSALIAAAQGKTFHF